MEGRVLSKEQVIQETIKILSFIELPMVHKNAINSIQRSIHNLQMVFEAMNEEKKAAEEVEDEHADAE
jgi:hypothetical protein